MEVAAGGISILFAIVGVYLIVRLLRHASRHDYLRREFISGTSFSQRRRFAALARAGNPVSGDQDSRKVKELLAWHRAMNADVLSREPLQQWVAALVLLTVAGAIMQAVLGEPYSARDWLIEALPPLVILGVITVVGKRIGKKHEETIHANGWEL